MTPNDILHLLGFRLTGRRGESAVQYVFRPHGMSPEVRRTDLRVDVLHRAGAEPAYRAVVSMKNRDLVFETFDVRDVAALAVDYRNWLEAPHIVARDPSRAMPIPGGLVSMPFHSGDGSWVAGVGTDGVERLRDPALRWGRHYEAFRDAWFAACIGKPLQAPPDAYLRAAGFVPEGDRYRLVSYPSQHRPGATVAARLRPLVFDLFVVADDEGAPFHVVETSGGPGIPGRVQLGSGDVRDILAFVVAAENRTFDEDGPQVLAFERTIDLPGHAYEVRNPFGRPDDERSWRGWSDEVTLQLAHPAEVLGHTYVQWRDRWAADVLAHGAPIPCSRAAEHLHTDVPVLSHGRVRLAGATTGVCTFGGGEPQPVAVFETGDADSPILMGREVLRARIEALTSSEQALAEAGMPLPAVPAAGLDLEGLQAVSEIELRLSPTPLFG